MDANFRLKNNLVSNYSQDPGLGVGWAYMVERKPYENYVLSRTNDQDVSATTQAMDSCSRLRLDQHLCGITCTFAGKHEEFRRPTLHGYWSGNLRAFRDDFASRSWQPAQRREVC